MYNAAEGIEGKSRANLGDILQFMTGLRQIPPLGFSKKTAVFFLEPSKVLPEVSACFYTLHLPVSVETIELSFERLLTRLSYTPLTTLVKSKLESYHNQISHNSVMQ